MHFRDNEEYVRVKCPYCGYAMPIFYKKKQAKCEKIYCCCKGRGCKKQFEIKI